MDSVWHSSAYSSSWFLPGWELFGITQREPPGMLIFQLFSHKSYPFPLVQARQGPLLQASLILFFGRFIVIQVLCWLDHPMIRPLEWIPQYSHILSFSSLWRTLQSQEDCSQGFTKRIQMVDLNQRCLWNLLCLWVVPTPRSCVSEGYDPVECHPHCQKFLCLGYQLLWTHPTVFWVWVHFGKGELCLQVGRSCGHKDQWSQGRGKIHLGQYFLQIWYS